MFRLVVYVICRIIAYAVQGRKWNIRNIGERFVCIFAMGKNRGMNQCLHWFITRAIGLCGI